MIGWSMGVRLTVDLAEALPSHYGEPDTHGRAPAPLLDRGSQYAATSYQQQLLATHGPPPALAAPALR